jgi:hypothetical protein
MPAFVRKHPALLVEWLRLANSFSRWRGEGRHAVVLALCAIAVVLALLVALSGHAASAIETLAGYWVLLTLIAALYAATSVSGRRRRLEEASSQSWLIATPIPPRSLFVSQAIRVLLPLVALVVAGAMFPMLVALVNDGLTASAAKVSAAAAGGLIVGGVIGWWTRRRAKTSGYVPSRYVPRPRVRSDLRPDAAALASWPIAQVLSWSRPENSRYVMITALLAVQGGSSAIAGLSVVAMYFGASYLAALLSAMTTVAKSAAAWLRATPITLMGFVWSVSRRALAHQLIGVALAIGCMTMLGAPIVMALELAALWLGLFISISGFALVDHYRGRSPLVKIALSVTAVAALATVVQLRAGAKS